MQVGFPSEAASSSRATGTAVLPPVGVPAGVYEQGQLRAGGRKVWLWGGSGGRPQFSQFSLSVMSHSVISCTVACQASLSITASRSLLKLMSIESVMPSNHLILCHPFLLPPSIFPRIRVFSKKSVLHIKWLKYWPSAPASVLR